ncbi:cobalamin biosynthesis protein [Streptomyces sp. NE5-10]|nr:cobalamin biosynthesis protein [Streptomyces sp. NE5-10]
MAPSPGPNGGGGRTGARPSVGMRVRAAHDTVARALPPGLPGSVHPREPRRYDHEREGGCGMRQLVLAVHGSTVPEAGAVTERLARGVRRLTGAPVVVGHLGHRAPSLPAVLDGRPGAVVVPLLLGDGYHRTVDVPAVAREFGCVVTPGLCGEEAVAPALRDRLRAAERAAGGPADAVVVAGAGSSRPGGNDGTLDAAERLGRLLSVPVSVAYCSAASPTPAEAVARARGEGFRRVAVAAHLLAPGRFTRALEGLPEAYAVSAPLADHPRLARLVADRYRAAPHGPAAVPLRVA